MSNLFYRHAAAFSIMSLVVLAAPQSSRAQESSTVKVLADKSAVAELAFWNSIKDSASAADFQTYIQNFPNGMFQDPALERFERNGGKKSDLPVLALAAQPEAAMTSVDDGVPAATPPVKAKKIQAVVKKKKRTQAAVKSGKKKASACRAKSIYEKSCVAVAKVKPVKKKVAVAKPKKKVPVRDGGGGGGGGSPGGGGWGG